MICFGSQTKAKPDLLLSRAKGGSFYVFFVFFRRREVRRTALNCHDHIKLDL